MKSVTTVLFVENDAVALTMYQKRLQREGFHVEVAEDGIAALRVLSEMTPDVVVLDLMLPKFSGRDVFDYMRSDPVFQKVPVVIFSNAAKSEWPKDLEASPTRILPKSEANFAALMELIREMIAAGNAAPAPATVAAAAESALKMSPASNSHPIEAAPEPAITPQSAEQFLEYALAEMPPIREHCLAFIKGPTTDGGRSNLAGLRQRLKVLTAGAEKAGCARLSLLALAWEALLAEIERKPAVVSPSILQTLAQAADCLRILLTNTTVSCMEPLPKARVLSVDDDEICNDVAVSALQRANMAADSVMDANAALNLLQQHDYDLVLLDINMPGLTGFELCEKLRELPHHEKTPVIFVTAYNNFENRKQSVLSGGGDLIAKPVSPLELALKVTIHLLKAPPKTVIANSQPPQPLVWKEPTATISHDTEVFLRGVSSINAAPSLVAPTTETRTTDPEKVEAPVPAADLTPVARATTPAREEVVPPARIPAGALAGLKMKTSEPVAPEHKHATPPPLPTIPAPAVPNTAAPVVERPATPPPLPPTAPVKETPKPETPKPVLKAEPKPEPAKPEPKPAANGTKNLESVAPSAPPSDKGPVVTQPPQAHKTPLPTAKSSSKERQTMTKENNPQFDTLVLDVAHIIFGDNAPDINVRLVRMALEQVWQNRSELQSLDQIAREIARIIFGENTPDINVRLVKMALERSNSIALFKAA